VYNSCELSLKEKKELCVILAYIVLPIYENKYPDDYRIKECLDAIQLYKEDKISLDDLKEKRAYDAYAAAYAADDDESTYSDRIKLELIYFFQIINIMFIKINETRIKIASIGEFEIKGKSVHSGKWYINIKISGKIRMFAFETEKRMKEIEKYLDIVLKVQEV